MAIPEIHRPMPVWSAYLVQKVYPTMDISKQANDQLNLRHAYCGLKLCNEPCTSITKSKYPER